MDLSTYLYLKKISKAEFARKCGLSTACIYNVLKGGPIQDTTIMKIDSSTEGQVKLSVEDKPSKLREWIEKNFGTIKRFARKCSVSVPTLYNACYGRKVSRRTAMKIIVNSKNEITLDDLSVED